MGLLLAHTMPYVFDFFFFKGISSPRHFYWKTIIFILLEDIFTAICRIILVINIQIFMVYKAHMASLCSVQPAPLSMAGLVGKDQAGL